jgi:ribosomal protein S18 acetylase RimI-like enzyme
MNENYKFRVGNATDIEQIKNLTWLAYSQFKNMLSEENILAWKNSMTNAKTYEKLFETATCFVSEKESKIVGSAFLIPKGNPFKWFDADCCYIGLVAVHPDFEGNGIGKKLTEMCLHHAQETGEKIIALHTSEFQNAARHIYEKMGFQKQNKFDQFGKTYWLYKLQLD